MEVTVTRTERLAAPAAVRRGSYRKQTVCFKFWWEAACPLLGSDPRKPRFVHVAGQGAHAVASWWITADRFGEP